MADDEMAAAHSRDYAEKDRMDRLRRAAEEFLDDPTVRCSPRTRAALEEACVRLAADAAHIVRAWD